MRPDPFVLAGVRRAVGEVLGEQLPAVVVRRLDVRVGALEERDVRLVPVPVLVVPERLAVEERLRRKQRLCGRGRRNAERAGECGQRDESGGDATCHQSTSLA